MNTGYLLCKKIFFVVVISFFYSFILISCGYQLCTDITKERIQINSRIKSIILCSYDPFGSITHAIKTELYANKINIFDHLDDFSYNQETQIPCLCIINTSENHITTSVFHDGKEAGYQLILRVQVSLIIPDKGSCPITVCVCRSFIRHPEQALHNDIQEDDIRTEMYQNLAQQLVYQLFIRYKDFY